MEDVRPEIISQAMRGDQTAIHQLYIATRDYAYFVAKTYMKQDDKAVAAVLQDSYIAAIGRLEDYNRMNAFTLWLHRVIAIKSSAALRSAKAKFGTKDLVGDPPMTGELVPSSWVEQPDRRWEVMRIVGGLPDGQRMALVMYDMGGMPLGEIAEVLGISSQEATAHLYNARQALRMGIPAVEETGAPSLDGRPLLGRLMDQEAAAATIPAEMARTIFQNVMMFFMTGGKVPRLETGPAVKSSGSSSGGFLSAVLPVLIMVVLMVAAMVFYVIRYNKSQDQTAQRLLSEYHQSKDEALAKGDSWPGVGEESSQEEEEAPPDEASSTLPAAQEEGEGEGEEESAGESETPPPEGEAPTE